jgi:hypothetical protein
VALSGGIETALYAPAEYGLRLLAGAEILDSGDFSRPEGLKSGTDADMAENYSA